MATTTEAAVILILGKDYDTINTPSVLSYLNAAAAIVARVIECAARKGITLSDEEIAILEGWVAAYLYTQSDATYRSRRTLRAAGEWNKTEDAYLKGAYLVDPSGCLKNAMSNNRVRMIWLGKPPSTQIDYVDRR